MQTRDQAYEIGAALALAEAGLTKMAALPAMAGKALEYLYANPVLARAAAGAGIGGLVGAGSDIGAGRGALVGGLGGAGFGLGSRFGRQAVRQGYKADLQAALTAPGQATKKQLQYAAGKGKKLVNAAGDTPVAYGPHRTGQDAARQVVQNLVGSGRSPARALERAMNQTGNLYGAGLGTLLGGGALMASQPSKPKGFLENLF